MRAIRKIILAAAVLFAGSFLLTQPAIAQEQNETTVEGAVSFAAPGYTGIAKNPADGNWYRIEKGKINWNYTGVAKRPENGNWYYIKNGKLDWTYTGIAKNPANGNWYRIEKGTINWNYTGVAKRPENGNWYYIKRGQLDWSYTGIAKNPANGQWFRIEKGKLNWKFTGLAKRPENGNWYYIRNGKLNWSYTGVAKNPANGQWFRVVKGQIDWNYTGIAKRPENGNWYYIKRGKLDWSYTGGAKRPENGNWYYIRRGMLDWNYSGLSEESNQTFGYRNGRRIYGRQSLGGSTYFFDETTGVMLYAIRPTSYANVYEPAKNKNNGKLIVLDPGHASRIPSGSEPIGPGSGTYKAKDTYGATGVSTRITEAQLNLTVAFQLRDELVQRGYSVALTRETGDIAISCIERTQIANGLRASAYLRIHADSAVSSARGAETICITSGTPYGNTKYAESDRLSRTLINTYCGVTGIANRGVVYTDTMTGNNWSNVPTTLIEMGFLSNAVEDRWMNDAGNQKTMVKGMADGIDAYFRS